MCPQSLNLVVLTMLLVIAMQHYLVRRRGLERHRDSRAVGYSCVLFALMTYAATVQHEFCPLPFYHDVCFSTAFLPTFAGGR